MLLRFFFFLLCQLIGGALGWWQAGPWGAGIGACFAAWLWFAWDLWRGARVLNWLRQGDPTQTPRLSGLWGEAADRARRLVRQGQLKAQAGDARLQEILQALQASPNGVMLLDAEGHIEWCNQMAEEHFGLDAERDAQQSIGNLVRDPDFSTYYASKDYTRDVVLPGRASTPSRPVRVSVHLHPYGDGRKLLLSRDVTALEQAEAMRRDFVANVSHEIRTPLTVLMGFVETLQTLQLSNEERARYLRMMSQQAVRMQNLVQDLLTLSRLEGSPPPSMHEWVAVSTLLRRCEDEGRALSALLTQNQPGKPHQITFPTAEAAQAPGRWPAMRPSCKAPWPTWSTTLCATRHPEAASPWRGTWSLMAAPVLWCATQGLALSRNTCRASPSVFTAWTAAARATRAERASDWPS